ncbi:MULTISPECIES: PTS glucose transporter subunit IIA [unclassified Actinotalea]|uniref:PTS sugar transporter subunit IIA n=1 Tax=unclassified Actinotalea TaxID=2638618 RepID=UPI0015F39826|nr:MULTISPECIES: PTS glucose transporter subunit IIA [unclassified Actinotalea]
MPLTLVAPVAGTVLAMADVPDPVFAGAIVGPGLAIDPDTGAGDSDAVAPVDGTIAKLHPHAFVVQVDEQHAVLVHLGLDTVQLAGEGFTLHVAEGDRVSTGQRIVSWDAAAVAAGGRSPVCPVVAIQGETGAVRGLVEPGDAVAAGTPFLEWA